jgi:hypothetical protein
MPRPPRLAAQSPCAPANLRNLARSLALAMALGAAPLHAADGIFANGFELQLIKIAEPDIEIAQADPDVWADVQGRCDADLNKVVSDIYAGFDWRQAAQDYGICYNVALRRGDPKAATYSKKAVAILKTLARTYPVIAANQNHQFLAFGDGTTKIFALPMPALVAGAKVRVFTNPAAVSSHTYSATPLPDITPDFDSGTLKPVLRIATTLGGATMNAPPQYVQETDYHVSMRDDDPSDTHFNVLHWLGANHPAGTYYVATNTNNSSTEIAAANVSVSGNNVVLTTAPAAGQAIFVQYLGTDYTQTSNFMGGVESVKPDGPGYNMRAMNVGLAYGYDAMRASPDLTPALRAEFYGVLNKQLDWYTAAGYEGPHVYENPIGNYYIRGYLTGALFSAYATDGDNPRAESGGDLKPLAHTLLMETFNKMQTVLPGGYGPQGTYSEGTNQDMLQIYDLWKRLSATDGAPEDLAPQLEWTDNLVRATIHGTKPDRATFYDGGDWNDLPATPLQNSMLAFVKYLPNHATAPYARQLLADLGSPVAGAKIDYKTGAGVYPLSYLAKYTGPLYARSDWSTSAVWLSLAGGPIIEDHQHADQGHFTLQRGADYLVINAGAYGLLDTLPWHNTVGFDDRGAGNHIVYPPGQGSWGDAKIRFYAEQGTFTYGEVDIAPAYVNNDGVTNSVTRALRTLVYIRPNLVVVHDDMQVAQAAAKKIYNVNFNAATLSHTGDVYSAVHGSSKVFMRGIVPANPTPVITTLDYNGGSDNASNYQLTTSGQTTGTFLHLFQLADSAQATMAASSYILSGDGRAEGVEVNAGARRWVVMSATGTTPVQKTTALPYAIPTACPCTHVVGDLMPSTNYQVTVTGGALGTFPATSDGNGLLTFTTDDAAATAVQIH